MTGHYDRHGNFEAWRPAGAGTSIKRSYRVLNGQEPRQPEPEVPPADVRDIDPLCGAVIGTALLFLVGGFFVAALAAIVRFVLEVL